MKYTQQQLQGFVKLKTLRNWFGKHVHHTILLVHIQLNLYFTVFKYIPPILSIKNLIFQNGISSSNNKKAAPVLPEAAVYCSSVSGASLIKLQIQSQPSQLMHQHVKGFGNARPGDVITLDDRLISLRTTDDIIGLEG